MPVYCIFNFKNETELSDASEETTTLKKWIQYKWNPNLKELFVNKFRDLHDNFLDKLPDTEVSASALVPDFIHLFQNALFSMKCTMNFELKRKQNASW